MSIMRDSQCTTETGQFQTIRTPFSNQPEGVRPGAQSLSRIGFLMSSGGRETKEKILQVVELAGFGLGRT